MRSGEAPRLVSRRYEVLEQLGRGGMGAVYKVRHAVLGSISALKVLPRDLMQDPDLVARFYREARIMANLKHRNIVRVLDIDHDEALDFHYFVMEYIEGQTLKRHLDARRALPLGEVLDIGAQVASALAYAHSHCPPVIHRDIKPSNVMIEDRTHRVVVMDFGIAKELDGQDATRPGVALGTLRYCAPEQMRQEPLDGTADIYALGMVLYEAYAGTHLLAGLGERELVAGMLTDAVENTPRFPPGTPRSFSGLVTRAMAKSRRDRYSSTAEFIHDLDTCRSEIALLDSTEDGPHPAKVYALERDAVIGTTVTTTGDAGTDTTRSTALYVLRAFPWWLMVAGIVGGALLALALAVRLSRAPLRHETAPRADMRDGAGGGVGSVARGAPAAEPAAPGVAAEGSAEAPPEGASAPSAEAAGTSSDESIAPSAQVAAGMLENAPLGAKDIEPVPPVRLSEVGAVVRYTGSPNAEVAVPLLAEADAYLDDRLEPPAVGGVAKATLANLPVGESRHVLRLVLPGGRAQQEIPVTVVYYPGWEMRRLPEAGGEVYAVTVSPDGARLAVGDRSNGITAYDLASGAKERTLAGHTDWVNDVAFSPDGQRVISGSKDHTLRLWDVATGAALRTLVGHTGWVNAVAFSPQGGLALSGSDDQTVKLWDVDAGSAVRTLTGHEDWILAVAFSPDGRAGVSAGRDKLIKLWDLETGTELRTLEGHRDWINAVAFSPDGKRLASASDDRTIKLWDAETGKLLRTLSGHTDWVVGVAFSPDGERLVSASRDQTVRVWNVESGAELRKLKGHKGLVGDVAFSPDGKSAFSGGRDRTLRQWWVAPEIEPGTESQGSS